MSYAEWLKDVETLHEQAGSAAWRIGYILAEIENDDTSRVISGSYSGRALWVAHYAVVESLVLFCARAWDTIRDGVSIRMCMERMPAVSDIYVGQIENGFSASGAKTEAKIRKRYDSILEAYGKMLRHSAHGDVRAMRSELYAHRIYTSKDRVNWNGNISPSTLSELVELASETVKLIGSLGLLCNSKSINHLERVKKAESHCRSFWRAMPRLADVAD